MPDFYKVVELEITRCGRHFNIKSIDIHFIGRFPREQNAITGLLVSVERKYFDWQRNETGKSAIVQPKFGKIFNLKFGVVTFIKWNLNSIRCINEGPDPT